jgi:hypothetical protein
MSNVRGVGSGGTSVDEPQLFPSGAASGGPAELEGAPASPLNPSVDGLVASYRSRQSSPADSIEKRPLSFAQFRQQYVVATLKLEDDMTKLQAYAAYCDERQQALDADRKAGRPLPEGLEGLPWHWQQQAQVARQDIVELKAQHSILHDRYQVAAGLSTQSYVGQLSPSDVERLKDGLTQLETAFDDYNQAVEGIRSSGVLAVGFSTALLINELTGRSLNLHGSAQVADVAGKLNKMGEKIIKLGVPSQPVVTGEKP